MVVETLEERVESVSAGQRLKAAREAHNLDRTEIARWLKLDEKFIKAIEEDDEENLPQPVFIAGYIRSYAKLVDLPSDQLVKEFTRSHHVFTPKIAKPPEAPVPGHLNKVAESLPKRFSVAAHSHPAKVKWFVTASLAIFVVGAVSWMAVFLKGSGPQVAALNEPQNIALPAPLPAETTDQPHGAAAAGDGQLQADIEPPKRITVPLQLAPLDKKERADPGVVAALGDEQVATKERLENIAMHFNADSWVEIRDATGKRLIRSLGVAGATKEVKGVAPFQVLIGYGPGVELTYNGEPYDFSQHQGKQQVARFTLNPSEISNSSDKQENNINQ
jgi:cytoskeleton protein RodZ